MRKPTNRTPFEKYLQKRKFDLLLSEDFEDREVLEVGVKDGENLKRLIGKRAKALFGLVNSSKQLPYVKKNIEGLPIDLSSIRGKFLPFPRQAFDLTYTLCFLQRITDKRKFDTLLREICRSSDNILILIESTELEIEKGENYIGRPIQEYVEFCQRNKFVFLRKEFINIEISQKVCDLISNLFDSHNGQFKTPSSLTIFLQNLTLPLTTALDSFFPANRNITKMVFKRQHDEFY